MSDAPAWLTELLAEHAPDWQFDIFNNCVCGHPITTNEGHRAHVAQMIWEQIEMPIEWFSVQRITDPRVIPSRSTDPVTSHKAAAAVTVKAGSQRAKLLCAFNDYARNQRGVGLTDEEAMAFAPGVLPNSEYSKRCSELREAGLIEPTGETRTGASGHQRIVSRITEAGRKVVQSI